VGPLIDVLGARVYLDANIIVYAVEGFEAYAEPINELLGGMDSGKLVAFSSAMTLAEVLVKPKQDHDAYLERAFKAFLRSSRAFELLPVTIDVLEKAAELRATTKLKLPDAIHVATAVAWGATSLLTNDRALRMAPDCNVVVLSEAHSR